MSYKLIAIGTSKGGLNALKTVLKNIPANIGLPVVIIQHRARGSDENYAALLQNYSNLPVKEAADKDEIRSNHIYVAPPDYHLLVDQGYFSLSVDEPVHFARPSIDVFFESAADEYQAQAIGIILTGANRDGSRGLNKIKQKGGVAIVQDPETAESKTMPKAALLMVKPQQILTLQKIGPFLSSLIINHGPQFNMTGIINND